MRYLFTLSWMAVIKKTGITSVGEHIVKLEPCYPGIVMGSAALESI
jgi:hypothetical protein